MGDILPETCRICRKELLYYADKWVGKWHTVPELFKLTDKVGESTGTLCFSCMLPLGRVGIILDLDGP